VKVILSAKIIEPFVGGGPIIMSALGAAYPRFATSPAKELKVELRYCNSSFNT